MVVTTGSVLVIDDDADVRESLVAVLGDNALRVEVAESGDRARSLLQVFRPDVILLDLGLPDISGLDMLSELIDTIAVPIIVISGRSGEVDRVVGLDLGADDYISKPFSEREVVARVKAAIRRNNRHAPGEELAFDDLVINHETRDVLVAGRAVDLTPKEFDLLTFLAQSPRRVFTRSQLLEHVWGSNDAWRDAKTVPEHIHRLRRKLDASDRNRWIATVRGVGYRFDPTP